MVGSLFRDTSIQWIHGLSCTNDTFSKVFSFQKVGVCSRYAHVAMPFCITRHVVDHDEDEWSTDIKAYKLDLERFFGIVIYCVSTLSLHTESTDSMMIMQHHTDMAVLHWSSVCSRYSNHPIIEHTQWYGSVHISSRRKRATCVHRDRKGCFICSSTQKMSIYSN